MVEPLDGWFNASGQPLDFAEREETDTDSDLIVPPGEQLLSAHEMADRFEAVFRALSPRDERQVEVNPRFVARVVGRLREIERFEERSLSSVVLADHPIRESARGERRITSEIVAARYRKCPVDQPDCLRK